MELSFNGCVTQIYGIATGGVLRGDVFLPVKCSSSRKYRAKWRTTGRHLAVLGFFVAGTFREQMSAECNEENGDRFEEEILPGERRQFFQEILAT